MASVGVTLIFLPGLKGGKLDGAVTILEDGRPVIGITGRGDRFDIVVFTLLHECAHLTLGHISTASSPSSPSAWVDDDVTGEKSDPKERAADEQAAAWTFPGGFEVASPRVPAIVRAAERYNVHPSLVIGRMQHEAGDYKLLRSHILRVRDDMPTEE
jgi:HTH-type transcriptional regulator/antitoxin HigA